MTLGSALYITVVSALHIFEVVGVLALLPKGPPKYGKVDYKGIP